MVKESKYFINENGVINEKITEFYTPNEDTQYFNENAIKDDDVVFIGEALFNKYGGKINVSKVDVLTVRKLKNKLYQEEISNLNSAILITDFLKSFISEHISSIIKGSKNGVKDKSEYAIIREAKWKMLDLLNIQGKCIFYASAWNTDNDGETSIIKTFYNRQEALDFIYNEGPKLCIEYCSELIKNDKLEADSEPVCIRTGDNYINCSYNSSAIEMSISLNYYYIKN